MIDYGAKETDELYAKMEKRLNKVYRDANADMDRKLKKFMREYEAENKAKRTDLKAGKISETEYNNWLKSKAFQKKQLEEMVNTLAEDYTKTDLKAMGIVRGYMPEAYAINRNFGAFQVEKGSKLDTSFTLYDSHTVQRLVRDRPNLLPDPKPDIPKEMRWHKQKINHAITQGILQGESISDVAKRLQAVTDMDDRAALRNARTAMTAAQNAGRIDSYKDAQKLGIELKKEWLASLDGRTRDSHRDLDGVQVEVDKTFPNGCEYPGDPTGDPAEVYNCRCTLVPAIAGIDQSNAPRNSKLGDMSYEEWKRGHKRGDVDGVDGAVLQGRWECPETMSAEKYTEWQKANSSELQFEKAFQEKYGISIQDAEDSFDYVNINTGKIVDYNLSHDNYGAFKPGYDSLFNVGRAAKDTIALPEQSYGAGYVANADGSRAINRYCRKGEVGRIYSKTEMKKTISAMNELIDASVINEEIVVDRWVHAGVLEKMGIDIGTHGAPYRIGHAFCIDGLDNQAIAKSVKENLVGSVITDNGFMSASASSDLNVFRGSDVKFSIITHKGTHAYITNNIKESELIFRPGTQQLVKDARIIEAEAFDHDHKPTKRQCIEILLEII